MPQHDPNRPKPNPVLWGLGCVSITFMACVTVIVVALIVYG